MLALWCRRGDFAGPWRQRWSLDGSGGVVGGELATALNTYTNNHDGITHRREEIPTNEGNVCVCVCLDDEQGG